MRLDTSFVKVEKCFLRCYFLTAGNFAWLTGAFIKDFSWRGGGGDSDKVLFKAGCNGPKVAHNAGRSTLADC